MGEKRLDCAISSEATDGDRGLRTRAHALFMGALLAGATAAPAMADEGTLVGRRGLAAAEETPPAVASCQQLSETLRDFKLQDERVDLWASGPLTLIETDQVLWYLAICSEPGIRVLCVTYSDNGMKVGEQATLRGAMRIEDDKHVVLDPCLASRD
ncbi:MULTISPECIES: hypothetical protein [unclassified Ensifer]|uniref:hypothetical protein n=1 Tax=unclassified Ensifer TaxID=2633371 RepID=UPI001111E7D4|nr:MULTISPECIES: hypothetical protein [unclassified Ensifer]